MAIIEFNGLPWSRKHDEPGVPVVPSAPRTLYPQTLEDLIEICRTRAPAERIHASGSHWALSKAALSDSVFVETHGPLTGLFGFEAVQALGKTLYDIVPPCLSSSFLAELAGMDVPAFDGVNNQENAGLYPVHIETGKRVYQLYSELDFGDDDPRSLAELLATHPDEALHNVTYRGPWAFKTLGGAGGQTVFGALTTGTHGGDFHMPPMTESVLAIHLVADGGKHFWIERSHVPTFEARLTNEAAVTAFYSQARFGGAENFQFLRDDDMFNAVLVAAGRFGIVYSIVIGAVRQYSLHQHRKLTTWNAVKNEIAKPIDREAGLYGSPPNVKELNRFLQIVVCVTPHVGWQENRAGVTKRWNVPLVAEPNSVQPAGRKERRGNRGDFDPAIQAFRFSKAGNDFVYTPDEDNPGAAGDPSFLEKACADGNFVAGVIDQVREELVDFVESNGEIIGPVLLAVTAVGGGAFVLGLIAAFILVIAILAALAAIIRASGDTRFGQVMNDVRAGLLNNPDPAARAAGLITWQMIVFVAFEAQQGDQDYGAISYAVMDGHDYRDRSCNIHVESIEVFFDAEDPMLIAFVDELLEFEIHQEIFFGKAFAGYISLRFMQETNALIGPQQFERSVAVEVAGLRDVDGTTELVDFAVRTALNANFNGILHWGQRNDSTVRDIEDRFGDAPGNPTGPLHAWREQLGVITDNGRLNGFSSAFTRQTGLEIVTPVVAFTAVGTVSGSPIRIDWDATHNPPETQVERLEVALSGGPTQVFGPLALSGHIDFTPTLASIYTATLVVSLVVSGVRRETRSVVTVDLTSEPA